MLREIARTYAKAGNRSYLYGVSEAAHENEGYTNPGQGHGITEPAS